MPMTNSGSNDIPGEDHESTTNGLNDSDTLSFINSLIEQNSELAGKIQQIDTLMKRASEQVEIARAESDKIISKAQQIAEQSAQEKVSTAQQKAQEILRKAEEQANRIISEAKQKAEAVALQARQIVNEVKEKAEKEALLITQEAKQLQLETEPLSESHPREGSEINPKKSAQESAEAKQALLPSGEEGGDKEETSGLYDGAVELTLPPPLAPTRLLKFGRQLRRNRQIKVEGLKGSLKKGIRIRLFLRNRIPLVKILEAIPDVETVSCELHKADAAHNSLQTRDELGIKNILVRIKK